MMASSKSGFSRTWATMVFFLKTHRKATFAAVLVILGLILVFQNTHPVRIYLFFWSVRLPLILWAGVCSLLGYVAGKGVEWASRKRSRRRAGGGVASSGQETSGDGGDDDSSRDPRNSDSEG